MKVFIASHPPIISSWTASPHLSNIPTHPLSSIDPQRQHKHMGEMRTRQTRIFLKKLLSTFTSWSAFSHNKSDFTRSYGNQPCGGEEVPL